MNADALARYEEVAITPEIVAAARLGCVLCGGLMTVHARAVLVPVNNEELGRMRLALPYAGVMAHYDCLKRMP